jgi:hypothetical protein
MTKINSDAMKPSTQDAKSSQISSQENPVEEKTESSASGENSQCI